MSSSFVWAKFVPPSASQSSPTASRDSEELEQGDETGLLPSTSLSANGTSNALPLHRSATFSACGLYRYALNRLWDPFRPTLPIIMLNPSTASATTDDPTIRRCMSFAQSHSFGGIRVANLFAYRSLAPTTLQKVLDPVGPENRGYLERMLAEAAKLDTVVLVAWGAKGHCDAGFMEKWVVLMADWMDVRLVCLGMTADGRPRHPLYLRGELDLVPYREGIRKHDHVKQEQNGGPRETSSLSVPPCTQ